MTSHHLPIKFDYIGLHVEDMGVARAFFIDRLGLEIEKEMGQLAVDGLFHGSTQPRQSLRLCFPETKAAIRITENKGAPLVDASHTNLGTCHVAFYTHDLDTTWSDLAAHGSRLISTGIIPIVGNVFEGGKAIYCIGPDGYRVEFLEGRAYLDGTARDPSWVPNNRAANEASHIGIHVRDRDVSLRFYRDLLGLEQVAAWLEKTPSTKAVIGYPDAELYMSILRLPGTHAYMEVIEYRNVDRKQVETDIDNNGTCHLTFLVPDVNALASKLRDFGSEIMAIETSGAPGGRYILCKDPDGIQVQFLEDKARFQS